MTDETDSHDLAARSARAMMSRDATTAWLGIELDSIAPGAATMTMTVTANMTNGHDTCHGGLIFTLADCAFAYACNSYDQTTVASSADITFVSPARKGDKLTATAREVFRKGRSGLYDVNVHNDAGQLIASFRGRSRTIKGTVTGTP